jgi:membrane-bound lytic murein transglycosylase MltF
MGNTTVMTRLNLSLRHAVCLTWVLGLLIGTDVLAQETDAAALDIFPDQYVEDSTADLSAMREKKVVRALITLSKTDFVLHKGHPKGLQVELLEQYEKMLNKVVTRRELKVHVTYVPVPFDELIPSLLAGRGDIAAALLTITPEREKLVNFISGRELGVDEIIVTRTGVEDLHTLDELSGRSVYVLRGSSYAEHLRELNAGFLQRLAPPIHVVEADENLLTEDILELVNSGIVDITVVDDFKAQLWAKVLPNIVLRNDLKVSTGGSIGWAVRRNNPELEASLNEFLPKVKKGTLLGNMLMKRYYGDTKFVKNPMAEKERERREQVLSLFKEYGDRYDFDWLAVAAQAYQESGLDRNAKSRAGAIGIMQLLPSTAEYVGISNITELENNIHAGVKYVSFLREHYFSSPEIADADRFALTWAAYNTGPTKVRKMRNRAKKMGLDPNVWFQNVEYAALAMVGQETVRYVANIYKYYIAYSLSRELLAKKAEELKAIKSSGGK